MSYSHKILSQNLLPQSNLPKKQKAAQGTHSIVFSLRRLRLTGISSGTLTRTSLSRVYRNVNQKIETLSFLLLRKRHFPSSCMIVSFNRVARRVSLESNVISIFSIDILRGKFLVVIQAGNAQQHTLHSFRAFQQIKQRYTRFTQALHLVPGLGGALCLLAVHIVAVHGHDCIDLFRGQAKGF